MNCLCGFPAKDFKVQSSNSANFGRIFFACASRPQNCRFFQFADEPLTSSNRNSFNFTNHQQQAPSSSSSKRPALKLYLDAYDETTGVFWFVIYPTNTEIVALIQKMDRNMYKYNSGIKIWMLNFAVYDSFLNEIQASKTNYIVEEIPKFVVRGLNTFMSKSDILLSDPELNLSAKMTQTLLPFQMEGVKFVVRRGGRALIGDEMGCGKTLQAVAVLQHYKRFWPALVLVPPNLMDQWARELLEHIGGDFSSSDLKVVKKGNDVISGKICIVSYTALDGLVEKHRISTERFGVVIADESHQLKSKEAKRTNNALPFLRKAQVALCLTGTPSTNRPVELYTQLSGLLPQMFSDYDGFTRRYCDAKPSRFGGMDVKGASNEKELNILLKSLVMIRRLKDDVVKLPEKNREILRVEPDPLFIDQLKNCKNELKIVDDALADPRNDYDTKQKLQNDSRRILINYINVMGLAKVNRVKEELTRIISELKEKNHHKSSDDVVIVPESCNDLFEDHVRTVSKDQIRDQSPKSNNHDYDYCEIPTKENRIPMKKTKNKRNRVILDDSDSDSIDDSRFVPSAGESTTKGDVDDEISIIEDTKDINNVHSKDTTKNIKGEPRDVWKAILNNHCTSPKRKTNPKSKSTAVNTKKKDDAWGALKKKVKKSNVSIGEKILIFGHHKSVMDSLEDCIRDMNLEHIRIDGDVSIAHRDSLINQFQTDESVEIALLSISACGTGLNLTKASIVIFAEISWSVGNILQAEDRVHRIGQHAATVRIIYVLAGWSDDIVWGQIQKKHEVINATVGMGNSNRNSVTNNKRSPCSKSQQSISQYMKSASCLDSKTSSTYTTVPSTDITEFPVPVDLSAFTPTCSSISASVVVPTPTTTSDQIHPSTCTSVSMPTLMDEFTESTPSIKTAGSSAASSSTTYSIVATTTGNMGSHKRPISPSTKLKIEAERLRALERKKSKCGADSSASMDVSQPPVVRAENMNQQRKINPERSAASNYRFSTANHTTVDVDKMSIQYVEKNTNIFQDKFPVGHGDKNVLTHQNSSTLSPVNSGRENDVKNLQSSSSSSSSSLSSSALPLSTSKRPMTSIVKRSID